ncbi:MAG: S8 family peptidase [Acidobacteria bacterium]|nr:S8 family peptidase [Acidobacteriota bacterium]
MRKTLLLLATLALSLTALTFTGSRSSASPAPAARKGQKLHKKEKAIPGNYIVVLDDVAAGQPGAFSQADQITDVLVSAYGGKVKNRWKHALNGYSAEMTEDEALALSEDPRVQFVEEDQEYTINTTQSGATWGLDRIDQRNRPLSGTYTYNWTGSGVRAYVIDTGIRTTHTQFGGRAAVSADFVGDGRNGQDCNGHGTHVAGTIGGSTYGVAKSVSLRAVRVLNCQGSGTTSGVISGVNWVAANRVLPAVANMSLGGGASSALDSAVNSAINAGVTFAVAAGNETQDACNVSPARTAAAITVGSTTSTDARSSFSNFGTCVDIFAPGSSITSAWATSDTATNTISGTSMATPHVAGVAALYLQGHTTASNATVRNALVNGATTNVITGAGTGSPNRLLYSLFF